MKLESGRLYRLAGGYDFQGGKYDTWQAQLSKRGWSYDIRFDAWFKPRSGAVHRVNHLEETHV